MYTGALDTAIKWFEQSLKRWQTLSNQQMIATDLANLGEAHHLLGSLDEAEPRYRLALSLFETLDDPGGQGFVLAQLGLLELDRGNMTKARELLVESLRLRWSAGERGGTADTLEALADTTWHLGDVSGAAKLLRTADLLRQETGIARQPVYETRYKPMMRAIQNCPTLRESFVIDDVVASEIHRPIATPTSG
jgi:non-specific serine/threonine protein kinase